MLRRLLYLFLTFCLSGLCLGPVSGPGTTVAADGPLPLSAFPRPLYDNGLGVHWSTHTYGQADEVTDYFINELVQMNVKWVKFLNDGTEGRHNTYLIEQLVAHDIMPIMRIYTDCNQMLDLGSLGRLVQFYRPKGLHYYEIYNEPNIPGWDGGWCDGQEPDPDLLADYWMPAAREVIAQGAYPGLPSMFPRNKGQPGWEDSFFLRFLRRIKDTGNTDVLYRSWGSVHNYFINHPPFYPTDEVNLTGRPLTAAEIALHDLTEGHVQAINAARAKQFEPDGYHVGNDPTLDATGFLHFIAYHDQFTELFGFEIPLISTEGGATVGSCEDPRYPCVDERMQMEWTIVAHEYLLDQAPDYYFATCTWLLAQKALDTPSGTVWEGNAWYFDRKGNHLPIVDALKRSPRRLDVRGGPPSAAPGSYLRALQVDGLAEASTASSGSPPATRVYGTPGDVPATASPSAASVPPPGEAGLAWAIGSGNQAEAGHDVHTFNVLPGAGVSHTAAPVYGRPAAPTPLVNDPAPVLFGRPAVEGVAAANTNVTSRSAPAAPVSPAVSGTNLTAYPRPEGDNGRGVHYAPTIMAQPEHMVDFYVREFQAMNIKWVKIMQGDAPKLEHIYLIEQLVAHDMEPVLRVYKPYNDPYEHLDTIVSLGLAAGVHYFELHNEPNIAGFPGGWRDGEAISIERILDLWIPAAEAVQRAGGYPGLPTMAPGGSYEDKRFLREFLDGLIARDRTDLLDQAWIPIHNYFLNHPFDYPADPVNQLALPLSAEEIAQRGLSEAQVQSINAARRNDSKRNGLPPGEPLGETIHQDSNAFRQFDAYAKIYFDRFGHYIPLITTEGGVIIGDAQDQRYPPITEADVTTLTLQAYTAMLDDVPAYYFAFMPWLVANNAGGHWDEAWEGAAWYKIDGSTLDVVPALKADPRRHEVRDWPAALGRLPRSTVPAPAALSPAAARPALPQPAARTTPPSPAANLGALSANAIPLQGGGVRWHVATAQWVPTSRSFSRLNVTLLDEKGARLPKGEIKVTWSSSWSLLMAASFGDYSASMPLNVPGDAYTVRVLKASGEGVIARGAPGYDLHIVFKRGSR